MAKNLTITGNSALDEMQRFNALKDLQDEGTTQELLKLQKALKNPQYRSMLKMIS